MPHPATCPTAGLFTLDEASTPIALAGVAVDAAIDGLCARVAVAHRYVNSEATPIEAVYVFPLDEGAAVCGFEAVIDGVVIAGEVLERDKAFERYDEALEQGDGGFLLDEERPDVFQASIGNLAPGAEVLVRLTYVSELSVDDGQVRFTLPTTMAPRYAPDSDRQGVGRPDAETLNPPVAWSVPYGLDLTVRLTMPGGVRGLASPSHPVSIELVDGAAIVRLSADAASLDRDFVLTADASVLTEPQAWVEERDGQRAIAVAFAPRLDTARAAADVVFVVDRSGSMGGQSIAEVRNAMQLCLRSLTGDCTFNIIGFGSTFGSLFPKSRTYDQANLDAAARHVEQMNADLGGTELEPALRFALEGAAEAALPRQVVVLTDGAVTNTDEVIALATKHCHRVRVFTLGIGVAASQHLVRGIARAGRGVAEFIHPGERIERKVLRLLERMLAPALDVQLDWIGGAVTSVPHDVPPVFHGHRLLTYGLVKEGATVPTAVRLTASDADRTMTWHVDIPTTVGAGATVTTLAARARIRELEEGGESPGARGSRQHARRASSRRQEIAALAIRHGLLSRETSYVAIERRSTPLTGDMPLRRVPVALPAGWGGLRPQQLWPASPVDAQFFGAFRSMAVHDAGDLDASPMAVPPSHASASFRLFSRRSWTTDASSGRPDALDALVGLQAADGSWLLDDDLAAALGSSLADLERAMPAHQAGDADARRAWATSLALAWLERHAANWQDEWSRLAAKARDWIAARVNADGEAALSAAAQNSRFDLT